MKTNHQKITGRIFDPQHRRVGAPIYTILYIHLHTNILPFIAVHYRSLQLLLS
jgi:hypothetical protein